MQDASS
ncbi:unnamed protein product, partial [Rotaria magnacalcarata]